MKRISDKRTQRSGLNHCLWGNLRNSLLITFLVVALLITAVKVAASDGERELMWQELAQETEGYWLLVDVIEDPIPEETISSDSYSAPHQTNFVLDDFLIFCHLSLLFCLL